MRRALVYRSDHLGRLSDEDLQRLNALGVSHCVDLRGPAECRALPNRLPGITIEHLSIDPTVLRRVRERQKQGQPLGRAEAVALMAPNPVIFACSNPDPEIKPALAHSVRSDLIMGTGRSDYPNQINNVICFPFIFRGALDARASRINDAMKIAAVEAMRGLVKEPVPAEVLTAAGVSELAFGKDYVIPKPMDARLLPRVARAVALAAVASGVARIALPADYMQD